METTIDYYKVVDIIDEGIMALNRYKEQEPFPLKLKENLLQIVTFLNKAVAPTFEELLFDKRITIDKNSLTSIHQQMNRPEFPEKIIEETSNLLEKTSTSLSLAEIEILEKNLLEISKPIWITIFHGR